MWSLVDWGLSWLRVGVVLLEIVTAHGLAISTSAISLRREFRSLSLGVHLVGVGVAAPLFDSWSVIRLEV